MEEVVIISAVRTPIGKFGGSLRDFSAVELGTLTVTEALRRANIKAKDIDSVIFGNVLQAGLGQNPARQIAVKAKIPYEIPAMTINEVCGSGLKAVILGSQAIRVGDADIVVCGGSENMSQAPYLLPNERWGNRLGDTKVIDSLVNDGLMDAFEQIHMGVTAEKVASQYHITKEEQDLFAINSQRKAATAQSAGRFNNEIVPVRITNGKGMDTIFTKDEFIRSNSTLESLQKLKPAFVENGTVTAGNSSGINDGAAAIILMRKSLAEEMKIPYLGTIKGYSEVGTDPLTMGYAPYYSIKKLLAKTNIPIEQIELFELNEAFASQSIAVIRDLQIPLHKVNVNGGAISLGHPIGASGTRILVTLLHEMERRNNKLGLASLCVGGGIGISMLIERE